MLKLLDSDSETRLIQLLFDKVAKKSLEQFTDQMKKAKKVAESWKLTFHKGQYLKPSKTNLTSVSEHVRIAEFTDSTHTIY